MAATVVGAPHGQSTGPSDQADRPASTARGRQEHVFRPDVQGLRAIAVLMVVAYHLYPDRVPGGFAGVDVFFVISGFLITGHLLTTYQRTGRVRLFEFWGRRARRLIPAAALVLTVTWLVSLIVLPSTRLPDTAHQVVGSALYFQNWILAHDAVDYLKSDAALTPVQHYWSLSVEEQFYIVWPLLFIIGALVARRTNRRLARTVIFALVVAVVAASLTYSATYTHANPKAAYFVTTTRIWELGMGGALALLTSRLGPIARQGWLAWIGLAMVLASAFVLSGSSAFPGTVALLPVLGAVLLLAAGSAHARTGPAGLTSLAPMVFIGNISYSLYLWHWPIIVLWKNYSGDGIGYLDGPAIVVVSVLLAWLTKVFVEDTIRLAPFITRSTGRSLSTVFLAIIPVALATLFLATQPGPVTGPLGKNYPGAAALADPSLKFPSESPLPRLIDAPTDYPNFHGRPCQVTQASASTYVCTFGDTVNPRLTVAVVGDSVSGQWLTALDEIAQRQHWKIVTEMHSLCPWTATMAVNMGQTAPYTACHSWGVAVMKQLLTTLKPSVVFTSDRPVLGIPGHPKPSPATLAAIGDGMATYWRQLISHGISVVPIRESPEMGQNIPDCLATHSAPKCAVARVKAVTPDPPTVVATKKMKGAVSLIDLNSLICAKTTCSPVVGNVVVYRDSHHLTATYTRTLEPYLEKKLLKIKALKP